MSTFESNPFADPEAENPFSDPSVRQATGAQRPVNLDGYNPFADTTTAAGQQKPATAPAVPPPQPAVMQPTNQPPPPAYSPSAAQTTSVTTEELQRRQEELERKAAELQRKEDQMKNGTYNVRQNNFPPLPDRFCVQPCFYQDFAVDIPLEFQRLVKTVYYLWMFYVFILFLNVLGSLAYFITSSSSKSGITFGLSLLWLILFTPCAFVCWYRPLYKAFRSDSSFNFFLFFFIFFFQFCVTVLQCLGIDGWGTVGWISGLTMTKENTIVAIIMLLIGLLFSGLAAVQMFCLLKVHRIYRSTGASFEKAQAEFATGVMSNRNVQQAAGSAAQSAAQNAFQGGSGNRY